MGLHSLLVVALWRDTGLVGSAGVGLALATLLALKDCCMPLPPGQRRRRDLLV